ncbi:MAG: FAD:protein FMN transferase [Treponema sp.]|nr:FAD:protein FMN transferase [Treponema sp.]
MLGTFCTITLFDEGMPEVYRNVFSRLREIDNRMSARLKGSDVDMINRAAGIEAAAVSGEAFEVIEKAVRYAEISGGAFDPSVGPLVSLWNIGSDNPTVPAQHEIDKALMLINWKDIELDREKKTVFLKKPGMALDLGAIAKGYAADEAAKIIKQAGLKRAIIDLGGNILTLGIKQDGKPWTVGIQNPNEKRGIPVGIVQVEEKTVVTSGVYERYFESEGIKYHHIFDTSTGYPCNNGLLSVTVIAGVSIDADALSTAVFVLGFEKGMALIESIDDAECIFILEDKSIRLSPNAYFILNDNNFRLVF